MSSTLSASYSSNTSPSFTFTHSLQPADHAAYLASLRSAAAKIQEDINRELTKRMEEDKAREGKLDEVKEEENYGEEVVEED